VKGVPLGFPQHRISTKCGQIGTGWSITLVDKKFNLLKILSLYIDQKQPNTQWNRSIDWPAIYMKETAHLKKTKKMGHKWLKWSMRLGNRTKTGQTGHSIVLEKGQNGDNGDMTHFTVNYLLASVKGAGKGPKGPQSDHKELVLKQEVPIRGPMMAFFKRTRNTPNGP